jgi:hypothetical protein
LILVLFVTIANATERINLTCKFDAVATGYVSKVYSVNLILEGNAVYNADGSRGNNRNAIFANGSTNTDTKYSDFSFQVYDGNEYRGLRSEDGLQYNIPATWTLNTGEVTCVMKRGWGSSYYGDNTKTIHDTVYVPKKEYVVIHDTVDNTFDKPTFEPELIVKHDTLIKIVHDTVIKIVKDSILDSSKATQRFSLRGKYVGLAANETDCEFYTHFLKYNDSVFNENGEYVDSFEIKLLYTSGSYYKTIKLERATLLTLMGHPAIYPTRKGNYYITTERNWNEESVKDWSKVKPSSELQKQIDRLRSEIGKQ